MFELSTVNPAYGVDLTNGVLTITQASAANDALNFSLSSGTYILTDTRGAIFGGATGNGAVNVSGTGSSSITIPSADVSSISVMLGSGTNSFNFTGSGGSVLAPSR